MNINELVKESHDRAVRKGWYDEPRTFGDAIALIHSEGSEALEAFRKGELQTYLRHDGKPEGVPAELADMVIRVCDLAGHLGIDLEQEIALKSAFNETRSHRHGGKAL